VEPDPSGYRLETSDAAVGEEASKEMYTDDEGTGPDKADTSIALAGWSGMLVDWTKLNTPSPKDKVSRVVATNVSVSTSCDKAASVRVEAGPNSAPVEGVIKGSIAPSPMPSTPA
jgi:hypothetical protein